MIPSPHIPDQQRWFEIAAVIITGLGKFIFMDYLNWRLFYIVGACLFWILYIYSRYRTDKSILKYWGFTMHNFSDTFKFILPIGVLSAATLFGIGHYRETNMLSWHILPLLILYPIWGTIQQFIIVGLISGNLNDMKKQHIPVTIIIVVTAIVFSIVHYPFLLLVGATFLMALFYTWLYLRKKNLYVLGIFHGWIGALFFYTILERDPFLEVFGSWL